MMVAQIIQRLQGAPSSPFALVEGAAQLASLGTGAPNATPAAYVYVTEEAASENERMNGPPLQRMEIDVTVLLVVENVSDGQGAAAAADVEAVKSFARAALLGWQPPAADDVITIVGGRLVRAKDGLVWWELMFAAATYLEGTA
ncbi:phage tail terminator protein [Methylobacterium flocculans]|uniref:phage tail terminator protein n=1 Tax=Methylobacterium flocculans TaxID=2984843 RepID=UPI0021F29CD7|nr:hypothetical protein [Methylobacterium sp. FF17]